MQYLVHTSQNLSTFLDMQLIYQSIPIITCSLLSWYFIIKLFSFSESLIKTRLIHLFHGSKKINVNIFLHVLRCFDLCVCIVLILIINVFKVIIQVLLFFPPTMWTLLFCKFLYCLKFLSDKYCSLTLNHFIYEN